MNNNIVWQINYFIDIFIILFIRNIKFVLYLLKDTDLILVSLYLNLVLHIIV